MGDRTIGRELNAPKYIAEAYECDESLTRIVKDDEEPEPKRYEDNFVRICVEPNRYTLTRGVVMRRINYFTFLKNNGVSQDAIIPNGREGKDTIVTCQPQDKLCVFSTKLHSDFFTSNGNATGTGEAVMEFEIGSEVDGDLRRNKLRGRRRAQQDTRYAGVWPIEVKFDILESVSGKAEAEKQSLHEWYTNMSTGAKVALFIGLIFSLGVCGCCVVGCCYYVNREKYHGQENYVDGKFPRDIDLDSQASFFKDLKDNESTQSDVSHEELSDLEPEEEMEYDEIGVDNLGTSGHSALPDISERENSARFGSKQAPSVKTLEKVEPEKPKTKKGKAGKAKNAKGKKKGKKNNLKKKKGKGKKEPSSSTDTLDEEIAPKSTSEISCFSMEEVSLNDGDELKYGAPRRSNDNTSVVSGSADTYLGCRSFCSEGADGAGLVDKNAKSPRKSPRRQASLAAIKAEEWPSDDEETVEEKTPSQKASQKPDLQKSNVKTEERPNDDEDAVEEKASQQEASQKPDLQKIEKVNAEEWPSDDDETAEVKSKVTASKINVNEWSSDDESVEDTKVKIASKASLLNSGVGRKTASSSKRAEASNVDVTEWPSDDEKKKPSSMNLLKHIGINIDEWSSDEESTDAPNHKSGVDTDSDSEDSANFYPHAFDVACGVTDHDGTGVFRMAVRQTAATHNYAAFSPKIYTDIRMALQGRSFYQQDKIGEFEFWRKCTSSEIEEQCEKSYNEQVAAAKKK